MLQPFSTISEHFVIAVYHSGHQECVKRDGKYHNCKKEKTIVKIPHITEIKSDDFCPSHHVHFENECHLLPSGNKMWFGCPKCYQNDRKFAQQRSFVMDMKNAGMLYNKDKDEWFMPQLPGGELASQKADTISIKNYVKKSQGNKNDY